MTDRHKLILKHSSLAQIIAARMYKSLCYQVEYEDVVQYAYLGLIDAIDRFNPNSKASFNTYASIRIRGYILDELRKIDHIGRYMREQIKAQSHQEIVVCNYDDCLVGIPFKNTEDKLDLERAVNKLSLIERQIIYYYYVQDIPFRRIIPKVGKKYVEIVEIHDIAINKLRKLIA